MIQIAAGVILAMGLAITFLVHQNNNMAENLGEKKTEIEDLKYDLRSWEEAGKFWERREAFNQQILVQRDDRIRRLNAEADEAKGKLGDITDEQDKCIHAVVSDDVLDVLWDDEANAVVLRRSDGDIDKADP